MRTLVAALLAAAVLGFIPTVEAGEAKASNSPYSQPYPTQFDDSGLSP